MKYFSEGCGIIIAEAQKELRSENQAWHLKSFHPSLPASSISTMHLLEVLAMCWNRACYMAFELDQRILAVTESELKEQQQDEIRQTQSNLSLNAAPAMGQVLKLIFHLLSMSIRFRNLVGGDNYGNSLCFAALGKPGSFENLIFICRAMYRIKKLSENSEILQLTACRSCSQQP